MISFAAVSLTSAIAQTPEVQIDYGDDPANDNSWPNLTANMTTAGLDRILRIAIIGGGSHTVTVNSPIDDPVLRVIVSED